MSVTASKRLIRVFLVLGIGIAVFIPGYLGYKIFSQKTIIQLYVFDNCGGCGVQNPCKPCTVFIEYINRYTRMLNENKLRDKTELKPYNIYMNNDAEVYKKNMTALGIEEVPVLPAVIIGKTLISGGTQINNSLITAVKTERRFIPLLKQFFGFSGDEKFRMGIYDEKTIVYFSLPFCEDCKKTDSLLETLLELSSGLSVIRIEPSDSAGRALYERYCKAYGVSVDDYAVPRLFIQKTSFLGFDETARSLENALKGNHKTIKIALDSNEK